MKAVIRITLKAGVLDPQGKAAEQSLKRLGFDGIANLRQGKLVEVDIDADTPEQAHQRACAICETLLANPVMEDYHIDIIDAKNNG